jgi:hypothetical protein
MHEIYRKPKGLVTRWASFENPTGVKAAAAQTNRGAKGHAFDAVPAGSSVTLMEADGSGVVCRIWLTIFLGDNARFLRELRLDMYWDGSDRPAVSSPLGDFFGLAHCRTTAFETELFSSPEGRSLNCFVPMPFREHAKIVLTNESEQDLSHLFYDVDYLLGPTHGPDTLYFHTHWRRESPNALGNSFAILPETTGSGRFLGCNLGIIADAVYGKTWWGEGEVKAWIDDMSAPTLCGTGTEDYIGTAWGQGRYANRTQGCLIADMAARQWCFYRHHLPDPIYFDEACRVEIQTIGGAPKDLVKQLQDDGAPLLPVSIDAGGGDKFTRLLERRSDTQILEPMDLGDPSVPDGFCNFFRQDDWCGTAYFYLDAPSNALPELPPVAERVAGMPVSGNGSK